jgi:hypothetical protein
MPFTYTQFHNRLKGRNNLTSITIQMPKIALQLETMIYNVGQTCYMFRPCTPIFREVVYHYLNARNTDNIKLTPSFTLKKLHTLMGKTKEDE